MCKYLFPHETHESTTHVSLGQIESHEAFGQGTVRKKRVEELLDKGIIWDLCGLGVFFSFIALLGLAVVVALYATDAISGINQAVAAVTATVGVAGVAAILTFAKFVFQVCGHQWAKRRVLQCSMCLGGAVTHCQ